MVNEVLFKHETPSFDDVKHSLFERFCINTKPTIKNTNSINLFNLRVNVLICVNLLKEKISRILNFKFYFDDKNKGNQFSIKIQ